MKYKVIKLIEITEKFGNKKTIKKESVYSLNKLGHAKLCARIISSSMKYDDLNNKVFNVIVQDDDGNVVFYARTNVDGIIGKLRK